MALQHSGCFDHGELHAKLEVRRSMRVRNTNPGLEGGLVVGYETAAGEQVVTSRRVSVFRFSASFRVRPQAPSLAAPSQSGAWRRD